jgi:hypothetical protein
MLGRLLCGALRLGCDALRLSDGMLGRLLCGALRLGRVAPHLGRVALHLGCGTSHFLQLALQQ